MKANTTLFDLSTIYDNLSYDETLLFVDELVNNRVELLLTMSGLLSGNDNMDERLKHVAKIEEELYYLNLNIKTFEEALMCHESKASEKRTVCGGLIDIWLN
jgi:hypothetical protein